MRPQFLSRWAVMHAGDLKGPNCCPVVGALSVGSGFLTQNSGCAEGMDGPASSVLSTLDEPLGDIVFDARKSEELLHAVGATLVDPVVGISGPDLVAARLELGSCWESSCRPVAFEGTSSIGGSLSRSN